MPRMHRPPVNETRLSVSWLVALLCALACLIPATVATAAAAPPALPPVLIVDAGLGDARYFESHWLGASAKEVASSPRARLLYSAQPSWSAMKPSPPTYLLAGAVGSTDAAPAPITEQEIVWAMDTIASREAEDRTVLIAQGAAGIRARRYLQDITSPHQSSRADIVGLVLLGTPNEGFSLPGEFPKLDLWDDVAARSGFKADDLKQGSSLLSAINAGRLPSVVRTLVLTGTSFRAAGLETDGVIAHDDGVLRSTVAVGPLDTVRVRAKASQDWPLRVAWLPASDRVGGPSQSKLPAAQFDRIAPTPGYPVSADAIALVAKFYQASFAFGAPATHLSSRLLVDVSGSMRDRFGSRTKLGAAKLAAGDFVDAMASRQGVSGAVPEDTSVIAFDEKPDQLTPVGSDTKRVLRAIDSLKLSGDTDIGEALRLGVATFDESPRTAGRVLILLSDGVNTSGSSGKSILSGPVAAAAKKRIRIETIGLGSLGDSDVGFLKKIAAKTGGSFHHARDPFELRRDFLRARFSSIGTVTVDAQVSLEASDVVQVAHSDGRLRRIELGIVPDGAASKWVLTRDGAAVATSAVVHTRTNDGIDYFTVVSPEVGEYQLKLLTSNGTKRVHVFAVTQVDPFKSSSNAALDDSLAMMLIAGTAIAAVVGLVVTVATSRRKKETMAPAGTVPTPPDANGGGIE